MSDKKISPDMSKAQFKRFLVEIQVYFNVKTIADAVIDEWYKNLERFHIPEGALHYIKREICEKCDRFPTNLVREWKERFDDFKAQVIVEHSVSYCPTCDNMGVRWGWKPLGNGKWKHFASPCPDCQRNEFNFSVSIDSLEKKFNCVFMPPGYIGGPLSYDKDRGFNSVCNWDDIKPRVIGVREDERFCMNKSSSASELDFEQPTVSEQMKPTSVRPKTELVSNALF